MQYTNGQKSDLVWREGWGRWEEGREGGSGRGRGGREGGGGRRRKEEEKGEERNI